jgi:SAM-dependent methyltransferase
VLEVGSASPSGSYRPLFDPRTWAYTGLDLMPGPNVDLVADEPYRWPIADASYDLIVTGQVLEHAEFFWLSFLEMRRILKPGGFMFIITPSRGRQHRRPVDCWRFYPDAYGALAKWAGLELLEVNNPWRVDQDIDFPSMREWGDCVGVFRRPPDTTAGFGSELLNAARSHLANTAGGPSSAPAIVVKFPHSRDSYGSAWSNLKFQFLKHWRPK